MGGSVWLNPDLHEIPEIGAPGTSVGLFHPSTRSALGPEPATATLSPPPSGPVLTPTPTRGTGFMNEAGRMMVGPEWDAMNPEQRGDAGKAMAFRGILSAMMGAAQTIPTGRRRGRTGDWVKMGLGAVLGGLGGAAQGGANYASQAQALNERQRANQFRGWAVRKAAEARRAGDMATSERMEYAALQGTFQGYMAEPEPKTPRQHQIIDLPQGDGTFIKVVLDPNNPGEFQQIGAPFKKQVSKTGGEWGTTQELHLGDGMYQRVHLHKTDPSKHRPLGEPYRKDTKELTVKDEQSANQQRGDRRWWKGLTQAQRERKKKDAAEGLDELARKRIQNAQKALPNEDEEQYRLEMVKMGFEAAAATDVQNPPDPGQPHHPESSVKAGQAEEAGMVDRITDWWAGTNFSEDAGAHSDDENAAAGFLEDEGYNRQ